jgi:hypothetical protein
MFEPPALDLSMLPHVSTVEGRLLLVGLLSLVAAGRASGLGAVGFATPLLTNCRSTLGLAFGQVKLIPCVASEAAQSMAGTAGNALEDAGRVVDRIRGRGAKGLSELGRTTSVSSRRPTARAAGLVAQPTVAGGQMLLRLVVSILAALSGLFAGAAAIEREKRERGRQQYRRRLHS